MSNSSNLESLKARIREDAQALLDLESFQEPPSLIPRIFPPFRTGNLADSFEVDLYSLLEQRGLEMVRTAAMEIAEQETDGTLRYGQALSVLRETYSFLENVWLTTGFILPLPFPIISGLRPVLWKEVRRFCRKKGSNLADCREKCVGLTVLASSKSTVGREPPDNDAHLAKQARASTVAKLISELNDIKPQMFEDESEYNRLRTQHPDFLTFKIAEQRPDLKMKVLAIQGSTRHIRLAQELAGAHHGREYSTIRDDWKHFKPVEFRRPK